MKCRGRKKWRIRYAPHFLPLLRFFLYLGTILPATTLRICQALRITPDEILTTENTSLVSRQEELLERLDKCLPREKETALALLETYLCSLR